MRADRGVEVRREGVAQSVGVAGGLERGADPAARARALAPRQAREERSTRRGRQSGGAGPHQRAPAE